MIFKGFELSMNISRINNYITWLGSKCIRAFIKYFHSNYDKITDANKHMGNDWYKFLDILTVQIEIGKSGKIAAIIEGLDHCMADWYYNTIVLEESTIISIERTRGKK